MPLSACGNCGTVYGPEHSEEASTNKATHTSDECLRICLQAFGNLVRGVASGKRYIIEPDFGNPYTLILETLDDDDRVTDAEHTHSSYVPDRQEDGNYSDDHIRGFVRSLIAHLNGGPGLSFHVRETPAQHEDDKSGENDVENK